MEEMYELAMDLKVWADQQNMVERSIQSFFEAVEHFQREDPAYITHRIASRKTCLCNGSTRHILQRIVVISNGSRSTFSFPLETTERGTPWKNRGRFYVRQVW